MKIGKWILAAAWLVACAAQAVVAAPPARWTIVAIPPLLATGENSTSASEPAQIRVAMV